MIESSYSYLCRHSALVKRASNPVVSERFLASPARVRRLLDEIAEDDEEIRTLYLSPGSSVPPFPTLLELRSVSQVQLGWIHEVSNAVPESETGAAVFWSDDRAWVVLPPFPIGEDRTTDEVDVSGLMEVYERDVTVGVVLLRMGRYAIGVVRGDKLLASKTDTRHVKSRHRAGGSSQRRFMRSRDRLIRELYDEACTVTRRIFEPYLDSIDCVLTGGERQTINGFLKRCAFLEKSKLPVMKRLLAVDRPSHKALESIHREVWKSRVLVFDRAE